MTEGAPHDLGESARVVIVDGRAGRQQRLSVRALLPDGGTHEDHRESDRCALGRDEPARLADCDVSGRHDLGHLLDVSEHTNVGGAEAGDARTKLVGESCRPGR